MKKYLRIFILALAISGITTRAYCYRAEVTDISGAKYFPAVKEALSKARESINLVMFIIDLSSEREDSKVKQLVNGLIEAKQRGVEVGVILDQNIEFAGATFFPGETKIRSIRAYKRLKEAGVKVYYDVPERYTHAKAIIIDKKIVILGSTNWTETSLNKNIETNVLINSKGLAGEILNYLKAVKIDKDIGGLLDFTGPSVPVSRGFMENPSLAPFMVKAQDERTFDIYLYLLRRLKGNPERNLIVSYDDLAKYLGIYEGWNTTDYRRQIIKALRKLEARYGLIKFQPQRAKEATITLLDDEISRNGKGCFELPEDYFNFGWNRNLSLRGKFCYLINLSYADISETKPFWSKSIPEITAQFGGVYRSVIYQGMDELRRKKLIEVEYDVLTGKPYEERMPKIYKALKLYDPKKLELMLKEIEAKYGKAEYIKARKYARIVFEENNPAVIEDIILKTKEYGEEKVSKAFAIVYRKRTDNPKKTYRYAVGIIEGGV